jgi:glycosyltransferase involved in cell wall biosynthesis
MNRDDIRPRVVFIDHCALLSGGEIALVRLLTAVGDRIDPHVILGEDGPLVERLSAIGVSHEVLPLKRNLAEVRKDTLTTRGLFSSRNASILGYTWRLSRRIRELDADVVHTNSLKAALYGGLAGRLARRPVVWHVRDRIADDYLPHAAVLMVRWLGRVIPNAMIANSASTRDSLPARRFITVVFNPVVHDVVSAPALKDRRETAFTIGLLGRLAPWKGQHVFLRAFANAFRGEPVRARLIGDALFGEDDYVAELRRLTAELGIEKQIQFTGFQSDIWAQIAEFDILVHCSTIPEPFGQVVIEGMVAGVAVIAADAGGPAEVLTDGVDGLLVPPGDHAALTVAMRRLYEDSDLRKELALGGWRTSRRFSGTSTADKLMEVYDVVLGRGNAHVT